MNNSGCKLIHTGFSEPRVNPGLEIQFQVILLKGKFKTIDEILEGRCFEFEISEINHNSFSHNVTTHKNINLLEETSSFSIADLVIHIDCVVSVIDCNLNRVSSPLSVVIESFP